MVSWGYQIGDQRGLHVRPIAKVITSLAGFQCSVWLSCHGRQVEARDLMGLMALEVRKGDILRFQFSGKDEEAASEAVQGLLSKIRL